VSQNVGGELGFGHEKQTNGKGGESRKRKIQWGIMGSDPKAENAEERP
jgi:hypothetical protein